jgi:hypothetical protein
MLNLSDKELDRLSREAANEYDPGDLSTPGTWEKLQLRLDTELGKVYPNLSGGIIRRISFYYAPVILLIVGVSYYFAKHSKNTTNSALPAGAPVTGKTEPSSSPPLAAVKSISPGKKGTDQSLNTQNNSYKATSTPGPSTANYHDSNTHLPAASNPAYSRAAKTAPADAPATGHANALVKAQPEAPITAHAEASTTARGAESTTTRAGAAKKVRAGTATKTRAGNPTTTPAGAGFPHPAGLNPADAARLNAAHPNHSPGHRAPSNTRIADSNVRIAGANAAHPNVDLTYPATITHRPAGKNRRPDALARETSVQTGKIPAGKSATTIVPPAAREAALSVIGGPRSLATSPVIDDSALRNFTANGGNKNADPIRLGKKKNQSLHINRPLQIGISIAPDLTTVNAYPSDKPGSIFGITLGYQIMNKLSVSTGLLLARKNYEAPGKNFHAPSGSWINTASNVDLDLVKGQLHMLEIPLNLRYDVNTAGNTLFYVSGGLSSYILKNENCVYYYQRFGSPRQSPGSPGISYGALPSGNDYNNKNFYPFATINLGVGVEAIISNSFSIQLEPYIKIPLSGVGYGQVQLNSFGINFAVKYAPLLKKSRH